MIDHNLKARFIDKVQKNSSDFMKELAEISSFDEPSFMGGGIDGFCDEYTTKLDFIFAFLIQVNRICDISFQIPDSSWVKEANICALYYLSKLTLDDSRKLIKKKFFRTLLFSIALNKTIDSSTNIIVNRAILCLYNAWKFKDVNISIADFNNLVDKVFGDERICDFDILLSNIKKVDKGPRKRWLDEFFKNKTGTKILKPPHSTEKRIIFEENLLYECGMLRYDDNQFLEMMNFGQPWPDVKSFKKDELDSIKSFFKDDRVNFLVNLIEHSLFSQMFTITDEDKLIAIFREYTKRPTSLIPEIIYYIFNSFKHFSPETKKSIAKASKDFTNTFDDPNILLKYSEAKFFLGDKAKKCLNDLQDERKRQLLNVKSPHEFLNFLNDDLAFRSLNIKELNKIYKKFDRFTNGNNGIEPSIYISFEKTLREKCLPNPQLENERVREIMLLVMWKWQSKGFRKACSSLMTYKGKEISIPSEEINRFNREILENPMNYFFSSGMLFDERNLCNIFNSTSENPMSLFVSNISLRPDFPKVTTINDITDEEVYRKYQEGSFQRTVFDYFKKIRDKNSFKFRNPFNTYMFYKGFLDRLRIHVPISLGFWISDKELYNSIKKKRRNASLCKFRKIIDYSMISQLFPLLEDEIAKYASHKGIVPLEFLDGDDFAHRLMPSQLLNKLISKAKDYYNGDLEMVGDFIWIYLLMYSDDGFNIRNNIMHGVDYPFNKGTLKLHFSITLLCLAEMIKRNEMFANGEDALFSDIGDKK